jgi:recombination protein RecA
MAAPFKQVEFDIVFNEGISRSGDLLDLAVVKDVVKKSGSWFSYQEEKLGQGREAVKAFLSENPKIYKKIEHEIKQICGLLSGPLNATKVPNPAATNGKTNLKKN